MNSIYRRPRFASAGNFFCSIAAIGKLILVTTYFSLSAYAGNLLNDPGFEATTGGVGTNLVVGWVPFGANDYTQTSTAIAYTGSNYFKVYQAFNGNVNSTGIYQDHLATAGNVYTASGFARTASTDQIAGGNLAWIEVTFRDVNTAIIGLYRSAIISTNSVANGTFPANTWVNLPVTNQYDPNSYVVTNTVSNLVAPPNTVYVRYQIMFQGDANYSAGSMYFDDQSLVPTMTNNPPPSPWNIVWNDEFNGTTISPSHWQFEIGNGSGGWGNNEQEYYTSRPQNAYVSNGLLHIVALKESYNGFNYTSARMKTATLFSKKYGHFEFRAKIPTGQGYWPAMWMMPEDSVYGGWASSGEIDVMENKGSDPSTVLGTIHFGGSYPNQTQSFGPAYTFPGGDSVTNFHTYLLDWTNNAIRWLVDGIPYESQTSWWSSSNPTNTNIRNPFPAPFDQSFYLILNLAVGGNFGGNPNGTTVFPGEMDLDYIRVYDQTAPLQISTATSGSNLVLSWPAGIVCHLQVQTNQTGSLSSQWVDLPGSASPYHVALPTTNHGVFYRLASP